MNQIIRKNGLLYSADMHTVLGVDIETGLFKGRIPFGAHYIDDEVFTECPYEEIDLTDSIVGIGVALFKDSPNLKKVKLSEKINELPPYLFAGCTALEKVRMPNVVYSFPEGLFQGCVSLTEIPFRAGIRELSPLVFEGCTGLRSLVIPSTVKSIQRRAVADCKNLMSVVLPEELEELDDSAFEGCENIHNIRISENNRLFYVNEIDGCLYERTADGDKLKLAVSGVVNEGVGLFKDNVDDEAEPFFTNEEIDEDDDLFSAEIEPGDESDQIYSDDEDAVAGTDAVAEPEEPVVDADDAEITADAEAGTTAATEEPAATETTRVATEVAADTVAAAEVEANVNAAVTEPVSATVDTTTAAEDFVVSAATDSSAQQDDVSKDTAALVSALFASQEPQEEEVETAVVFKHTDSKTKILLNSVEMSKVLEFNTEVSGEEYELFVIAELSDISGIGERTFTKKLVGVAERFAQIKGFDKVTLLYGLPFENDEFAEFFRHYMSSKSVVFACEAPSPSMLSDYGKQVCEYSRISLSKEDLLEQKNRLANKNKDLIKLVIQDKK